MATHLSRKDLKQDALAINVEKSIDYAGAHRGQIVKIVGGVVIIALVVAGVFYYRNSKRDIRQAMLGEAITAQNAAESPTKKDTVAKAYNRIVTEHGGSSEAYIATYTLGTLDAESGKIDDARRKYQDVIEHADANYASLAKLSLAQLNFATGRSSEAQALLKDLMANPTELVSKNQTTFTLAKGIALTQPEEARKLLVTLTGGTSEVSQTAVQAISDLPPPK